MRRRTRRSGFTLLEVLLAAALALGVMAGAWAAFTVLQRQGAAVTAQAAGLRGLAMVRARLLEDLAAMVPLEDPASEVGGVALSPDRRSLRLRRFAGGGTPDQAPGGATRLVTWTVASVDGRDVLVRREGSASATSELAFPGVALDAVRYRLVDHAARRYLEAEFELAGAGTVVKVARALPAPSVLPSSRIGPAPAEVLAAAPAATRPLPVLVLPAVTLTPR